MRTHQNDTPEEQWDPFQRKQTPPAGVTDDPFLRVPLTTPPAPGSDTAVEYQSRQTPTGANMTDLTVGRIIGRVVGVFLLINGARLMASTITAMAQANNGMNQMMLWMTGGVIVAGAVHLFASVTASPQKMSRIATLLWISAVTAALCLISAASNSNELAVMPRGKPFNTTLMAVMGCVGLAMTEGAICFFLVRFMLKHYRTWYGIPAPGQPTMTRRTVQILCAVTSVYLLGTFFYQLLTSRGVRFSVSWGLILVATAGILACSFWAQNEIAPIAALSLAVMLLPGQLLSVIFKSVDLGQGRPHVIQFAQAAAGTVILLLLMRFCMRTILDHDKPRDVALANRRGPGARLGAISLTTLLASYCGVGALLMVAVMPVVRTQIGVGGTSRQAGLLLLGGIVGVMVVLSVGYVGGLAALRRGGAVTRTTVVACVHVLFVLAVSGFVAASVVTQAKTFRDGVHTLITDRYSGLMGSVISLEVLTIALMLLARIRTAPLPVQASTES